MRQLLGTTIFEARLTPDQQELVRGNMNVVLAEQEMQRSAADSRARRGWIGLRLSSGEDRGRGSGATESEVLLHLALRWTV